MDEEDVSDDSTAEDSDIIFTTNPSSNNQSMLQNILFWLLISFSIFLIIGLFLRLLYWQRSKVKREPSDESLENADS